MSSGTGNMRGGKGYKKKKTNRAKPQRREIEIDVEGGDGYYGIAKKLLGGNQVEVNISDGTVCIATIPGKFMGGRGSNWIKSGDKLLLNRDKGIEKIIRQNDKESRDVTNMMQKSSHEDIFGQHGEDDIEMDENATSRPSKLTLKNRNVKRMQARDTESFTDPTILQRQAELGFSSEDDEKPKESENVPSKKDSFGNDLEDVLEKMEKKKTSHLVNDKEKTKTNATPATESDCSDDSSVEIEDI
jgi:translation initiation factor IF-1